MTIVTLDLCAQELDLCFNRGDTFAWVVTYKDSSGTALDLTGYGAVMTVNLEQDPEAAAAQECFTTVGTVLDQVTNTGQVQWQFTDANWTAFRTVAGTDDVIAYHDQEFTDGTGAVRTFAKGKFTVDADITKNP